MKVYISTDLEGVCSFVDWEEATFKTGRGIQYTKAFLTAEVNAAIEGVLQADAAAEFLVQDGHGGGHWGPNMIAEELNPRASLLQGKRGIEVAGLDAGFDLFMEVGSHAMAGTQCGVMNHTISSDSIMNFWINGVLVGEVGIRAAIAGAYGVPVGLVTGDHWAVEEAKALLGDIEGVAVKRGFNLYTAECLNPDVARRMIREAARSAAAGRARFKPYIVSVPAEVKIEYTRTIHADRAALKGAERLDGRTVCFRGDNFVETLYKSFA